MASPAPLQAQNPPPNILLIIGDDQAYPDYGFMQEYLKKALAGYTYEYSYKDGGHLWIDEIDVEGNVPPDPLKRLDLTPNLDKLANSGIFFPHAHNVASKCKPSYAAILSGSYLINMHKQTIAPNNKYDNCTIPELLWSKAGYLTLGAGKIWPGVFEEKKKGARNYIFNAKTVQTKRAAAVRKIPPRQKDAVIVPGLKDFIRCATCDFDVVNDPNPCDSAAFKWQEFEDGERFPIMSTLTELEEILDDRIRTDPPVCDPTQDAHPFFITYSPHMPHRPYKAEKYCGKSQFPCTPCDSTGDNDPTTPDCMLPLDPGKIPCDQCLDAGEPDCPSAEDEYTNCPLLDKGSWYNGADPILGDQRLENGKLASYFNAINYFDKTIGEILNFLNKIGKRDNLLIIYVADNGINLREAKGGFTENGYRTPLIVNYCPPGEICDTWLTSSCSTCIQFQNPSLIADEAGCRRPPAHVVDILPTILEYAGITAPDNFGTKITEIFDRSDPQNPILRCGEAQVVPPLAPSGFSLMGQIHSPLGSGTPVPTSCTPLPSFNHRQAQFGQHATSLAIPICNEAQYAVKDGCRLRCGRGVEDTDPDPNIEDLDCIGGDRELHDIRKNPDQNPSGNGDLTRCEGQIEDDLLAYLKAWWDERKCNPHCNNPAPECNQ